LPEEPLQFVRFHLDEMKCDFCQANHDDLTRMESAGADPFLDRMQASTVEFLRSQVSPPTGSDE
jgi:hypothetical protein